MEVFNLSVANITFGSVSSAVEIVILGKHLFVDVQSNLKVYFQVV